MLCCLDMFESPNGPEAFKSYMLTGRWVNDLEGVLASRLGAACVYVRPMLGVQARVRVESVSMNHFSLNDLICHTDAYRELTLDDIRWGRGPGYLLSWKSVIFIEMVFGPKLSKPDLKPVL